jgi:multiple sugar transport system substrate-binding protein
MSKNWTRRQVLSSTLAAAAGIAAGRPAWAAAKTLNVLGHRVHQNSLTTGVAGDLTKPWRDSNDTDIVWTTFDTDPLQDRLFREASLDSTDFGVGFLVNSRATPTVAPLLQPLDAYRARRRSRTSATSRRASCRP